MSNKKLGAITGFAVVIIMAFLVIYLASPCDGNYKFSLTDMTFECSAVSEPIPEPIPPASVSEQPTPIVVPKTTEASIHSCINNKVTDAESKIRQEIVRLGVAAGLGKLLACRTVIVNKEKSGNGPKSNEYLFGIPECFLVSAEVEDRAKIIECGTKNGKPHIEVEVKGKGCEFSNKATFEIVAKYKSKIDKNARELIEKECKEEY